MTEPSGRKPLPQRSDYRLSIMTDDIEYDSLQEPSHPRWWSVKHSVERFSSLPENAIWNCYICIMVLAGVVWQFIQTVNMFVDTIYNLSYAVHMAAIAYHAFVNSEIKPIGYCKLGGLVVDIFTFTHYIFKLRNEEDMFVFLCYYVRLHRPFGYLWTLTDYNLKGSVLGTTLKYCYIFMVLRITWAFIWLGVDMAERLYVGWSARRTLSLVTTGTHPLIKAPRTPEGFLNALYIINKMFIPIGPAINPEKDIERITCILVMLTGCLVVAGAAVASLALVVSLYMRPEESFRARYRLIIKEMQESNILPSQREKVQTFYKMYWHKQKAVSETHLLPTFPPTLPAAIYTEIYFEALQKSKVLCDLPYEFLSEIAKIMKTKLYIPGDAIIKRSSKKSDMIFISHGDIEMMTAEDDSTAILRMIRGSILSPYAVYTPVALCRAHVEVRAGTFCTAHVLNAADLWHVTTKYGRDDNLGPRMLDTFDYHLHRVKKHYETRKAENVTHKSSIFYFKRCLMALKEAQDADGDLLLDKTDVFLEIAGCYSMRNRADASLTDEADAICLRPTFPCILQPESSLLLAWNLFVACMIITVCFVHPYFLVYKKKVPIEFTFFDYSMTIVFALDLIVHLSTGNNIEDGVPITFMQTSSQQMRSTWFLFDALATLPIFEFIGEGHFAGINKLLKLPKVFRVLKGIEEICDYRSNAIRFFSYTFLMFMACYLMAALQQGVMCYHFGRCLVTNFTHHPFWEYGALDEDTVEHRLTFSMYYAISMIMLTTHKVTKDTNLSYLMFTMFLLELIVVLRIFMEAVYSATIMVTTALRDDYDATIAMVKSCFIRNRVDPVLRRRFITYLELCWYTDKAYYMTKKKSIFYDLPPHVFQDIVAKQRTKYLLNIPVMKYLSKECLKEVSSHTRLFYASPNEIIINTGDITNEMYVIKQGFCELLCPEKKTTVALLGQKSHFGVFLCLLRLPAYYTVRAVTHVEIFFVSRKYLEVAEVPQIKNTIDYIKSLPEFPIITQTRKPFLSYVAPAPPPNKEDFKLPRKHELDTEFLQPFYGLGYLSVLRYMFPRFTIRPDGPYLMRYEWFRGFCALASAMVFPNHAYLELYWPWLSRVTLLLDLTAYFDILQRMLVGYFNELGILVYHPASTAVHYLRGAFILDLFGCIPWEDLEEDENVGVDRYRITQTKQFLMLGRLLQLYRLPSAMLILSKYIERGDILLVLRAIPLFMVVIQVLTGLIVLYSVNVYYTGEDERKWSIEPLDDEGGSWIYLFKDQFRFNMTQSLGNLYLGTLFWVVYETSTTGYNVFNPSNFYLMRILFLGMLTSAMIITYYSVRIISIRANVNKALASFQEHMRDMLAYMKRERLDTSLQKEVFTYYEVNWDKMGGVDYRSVFKLCDQISLRTDAILHIYGPTFSKCPILAQGDVALLRIIGRAVHSMHFLKNMTIINESDVISDMYFIDYGGIKIREMKDSLDYTQDLAKGSVFGNLDGENTFRCPITCVASTRVHLLKINSAVFHRIINEFPAVKELMMEYRGDRTRQYIESRAPDSNIMRMKSQEKPSSAVLVRGREGLIKYLYFKDKILQTYLILVSMVTIYADIYNAGFQDNGIYLITTLYIFDCAFIMKIIIYTIVPKINEQSHVQTLLSTKIKLYFANEFKYDLLSCLPIEILCLLNSRNRAFWFSVLRLNRTLRITTLYNCLKHYREKMTVNLILTTVISVFIWFTLSIHAMCCMWYFIGMMEDRELPKSSWIYKDDGSSWCESLYVCSMYFVLTTFTHNGVGDIMPKRQSEVIFVSLIQLVSTMAYMMYVGEFSNIIQYQSFRSFNFYSNYLELQEFLKNNRVSKNLVHMVNRYSLHLWRETRGMQEPHFLLTAPRALRLSVMSAAYLKHLKKHHIFSQCEPAFLRQLAGCFRFHTYNKGMYVVKTGDITDSMYFIHKGKVQEISSGSVIGTYYERGCFGVEQGLIPDSPFEESYRTSVQSEVLTLRLGDWLYLLEHFPESKSLVLPYMGPPGPEPASAAGSWDPGAPPSPPAPPAPGAPPAADAPPSAPGAPPSPPAPPFRGAPPAADALNAPPAPPAPGAPPAADAPPALPAPGAPPAIDAPPAPPAPPTPPKRRPLRVTELTDRSAGPSITNLTSKANLNTTASRSDINLTKTFFNMSKITAAIRNFVRNRNRTKSDDIKLNDTGEMNIESLETGTVARGVSFIEPEAGVFWKRNRYVPNKEDTPDEDDETEEHMFTVDIELSDENLLAPTSIKRSKTVRYKDVEEAAPASPAPSQAQVTDQTPASENDTADSSIIKEKEKKD